MLKPSLELTKNKISDYSLVVGIAKKAREIAADAETRGEILEEKPVDLAVEQYLEGRFEIVEPSVCSRCGRLDCICDQAPAREPLEAPDSEACEE